MEKLKTIKILLSISDDEQDELLQVYLDIAKEIIMKKTYPMQNTDDVCFPQEHNYLQVEIAQSLYRKRGTEGVAKGYSGNDVPSSLLQQIVPYGSVK